MTGVSASGSPRFLALDRTRHRGFLSLFRFMFIKHKPGRAGSLFGQFLAMVGTPIERIRPRAIIAGEMRHHVALIKLVGAFGLLEISPVVDLLQEGTEFALLVVEALDQSDRVIRRADHAIVVLHEPFRRALARRYDEPR